MRTLFVRQTGITQNWLTPHTPVQTAATDRMWQSNIVHVHYVLWQLLLTGLVSSCLHSSSRRRYAQTDAKMMAKAPNSPSLPGTGSMGELSPKLTEVDVRVHPTLYPITTIWVLFWTEKLAVAFEVTQILTKLTDTMFNMWVALILYVATETELFCNRWLRDSFGINSISIVYWMMSDLCLLGCRVWERWWPW